MQCASLRSQSSLFWMLIDAVLCGASLIFFCYPAGRCNETRSDLVRVPSVGIVFAGKRLHEPRGEVRYIVGPTLC